MPATRWLSPEEQRAWRGYLNATRLLMDALNRELRTDGLSHASYEILVRLSEAPGRARRMSELAAASLSSRSRVSHAVARLEEQGWVRREDCPSDRRGQMAVLTDVGLAALEAAAAGHVGCVRASVFDALSPVQVTQLTDISEALVEQLGGTSPSATLPS